MRGDRERAGLGFGLVGERPGIAPALPLVKRTRARIAGDHREPGARMAGAPDFVLTAAEQLRGHAGSARGAVDVHLLELIALDDDESQDLADRRLRDPRAADASARPRKVLRWILPVRDEPRRDVSNVAIGPTGESDAADSLGIPRCGLPDDERCAGLPAASLGGHFLSVSQTGRPTIPRHIAGGQP